MIMIQINPKKHVSREQFVWAIKQKEKTTALNYMIIKYIRKS